MFLDTEFEAIGLQMSPNVEGSEDVIMGGKVQETTTKKENLGKKTRGKVSISKAKWTLEENAKNDDIKLGGLEGGEEVPI